MKNDVAIVVFSKNPEFGKVKTRLIPEIGEEAAYNLYCELLKHTLETVLDVADIDKYVFTTPGLNHSFFNSYQKEDSVYMRQQQGEDLGLRMHHAFSEILKKYKSCVLLGCDCPEIDTDIINEAIVALKTTDVVIGPANDGGYYLIGLSQPNKNLFSDIEWSRSDVLEKTVLKVNAEGLSYIELPRLIDVDDYSDLNKLSDVEWLKQYLN